MLDMAIAQAGSADEAQRLNQIANTGGDDMGIGRILALLMYQAKRD